MKKPHLQILVLADYGKNVHTGFATVARNIIYHLKKIFGNSKDKPGIIFHVCAINYYGDKDKDGKIVKTFYQEDEWTVVFSARFDLQIPDADPLVNIPDSFGRKNFLWALAHSNDDEQPWEEPDPFLKGYDGIFIIQDAGIINSIVPALEMIQNMNRQANKPNFKSIYYFPCDFDMVDVVLDKLGFFDVLITYNEYSRQAILKFRPEFKKKLKVIPHGIDTSQFYPLSVDKKEDFREKYFGENADKFIVLNLNRNQPRKDIPCTIFGFVEFKKTHPDAFLYLHMNPKDPLGYDLNVVMLQVGLVEGRDYMFPPKERENHEFTVEEVNQVYNACDVYLTTTKGEGWGLGVTEAMACRLPVICPVHTSFFEIGGPDACRMYPLENLYPMCTVDDSIVRQQCDYLEVAERLAEVYQDIKDRNEKLDKKVDAAFNYVQTLHWEGIAGKFAHYFKETF